MATITEYRAKMDATVKEAPATFSQANKDLFIAEAVRQYTHDRPRSVMAELTGTGSAQTFAVPSDWVADFSVILELEFPISEVPRRLLTVQDHLEVFRETTGVDKINTIDFTLASGEKARILITALHIVSASQATVPDTDFDAVASLASAKLARAIALFHAEATDSSLPADVVDHQAKAEIFNSLAGSLEEQYEEHIGSGRTVTGAMSHFDLDTKPSTGGDFLFHLKRNR